MEDWTYPFYKIFKKPSFIPQACDHLRCSIRRQSVENSAADFPERLFLLEIEDTNTETRNLAEQTQERTKLAQEPN